MKTRYKTLKLALIIGIAVVTIAFSIPSCLPPDPNEEIVSIQIENKILYVNKTPVFPTGIYFWPDWAIGNGHHPLDDIASVNGNVLVAYYEYIKPGSLPGGSQLNMKELTEGADERELYFFVGQPLVEDIRDLAEEELSKLMQQTYDVGKQSKFFLGFMIDEPPNQGYSLELTKRFIKILRAVAKDRLVWVNFSANTWSFWTGDEMAAIGNLADIVSGDIYPIPEGHCGDYCPQFPTCDLEDPGRFADKLSTLFPQKALWFIQQANRWREFTSDPPAGDRFPTLEETRYMSYDLIIHAVRGVFYFGIMSWGQAFPYTEPMFAEYVPTVASEIRKMSPYLLSGKPTPVHVDDAAFAGSGFTADQKTLVLIALESHESRSASVVVEGITQGVVRDFFTGGFISTYNSGFAVTFSDHEARAFLITGD